MLSKEEIFARVQADLVEMFEVAPESITNDSRLYEDLDIDSIDAVDLVVRLQRFIGRKISPSEFRAVRTVGDVVDCISSIMSSADT